MGRNGRLALAILAILTAGILFLPEIAAAQAEPLTLQQAIDIALENNLTIIVRKADADRAKYDRLDAWGDILPSAGFSASYNFNRFNGPVRYGVLDTTFSNDTAFIFERTEIGIDTFGSKGYSAGARLNMTLFDGGYSWFRVKQANQLKRAADRSYDYAIASTAHDVKIAYFTLLRETMLKRVQQDALARSKKQLEVTSSRYELGSASLSERLKAEVNVANDSLRVIQSENSIRAAEFNLNLILNRDVSIRIEPTDTLAARVINTSLDELLQTSFTNNPSLLRAKAEMDAANTGIWMSRSSWFPQVSANMGWGWDPADGGDWFAFKGDQRTYSFGVSISFDIFNSFTRFTNVSRAKLGAMTARESYENESNILSSQVRQGFLDYQQARMALEVAELATRSAEEDMKLQQERYRLGASSILELLDAQVSLTTAQSNRVIAFFDLNRAIAELDLARGER